MLETLNTILRATKSALADDRVLWRDCGNKPDVTMQQFQQALAALCSKIAGSKAQRWLLYSDDPYYFLLGFLALLGLNRKVVISASLKQEWLLELNPAFDAVLCDEKVELPEASSSSVNHKTWLDFGPSAEVAAQWQPKLDGSEEIVFFTSGSTGQPKAVEKKLLALTNEVTTLCNTFAAELEGCLFAASVSHLHIYGLLFKLLLPLQVNAISLRQQIEYPEQLLNLADKIPLGAQAVFISSPTFLSRLDLRLVPVTMRAVFSSGGPLGFAAARASRHYFSQLPIEVYGSTETGGIGYRQQREASAPWTAFAGVALTTREDGVALRSPNMPGQPAYLLDDHLEFLPDGRFVMKGRKDRVVKIAEKRISLTEIEKFLEAQPTILQCVATLLDAKRAVIGCAVVLSEEGVSVGASSGQATLVRNWKAAMQNRFEPVTIPRLWRVLEEIPVNSQSKLDHAQLSAVFSMAESAATLKTESATTRTVASTIASTPEDSN